MKSRSAFFLFCILSFPLMAGEKPAVDPAPARINPELKAALEKLKLPGVKINLEERSVDVDSHVCLEEGLLELIASTKNGKIHESIIAVDAKPSHIHSALLLLGAEPGNPAMQKPLDDENMRFIHLPPAGGPVDVSLVFKDAAGKDTEHPISDFIEPSDRFGGGGDPAEDSDDAKSFPTNTFLFAGSVLIKDGDGPRTYLSDQSGNVISLSSFGDELLCLPGFHEQANEALAWQINSEKLPALDTKVILRLRPQIKARENTPVSPTPTPPPTENPQKKE